MPIPPYDPQFHSGGEGFVTYNAVRYDVTNATAEESVNIVQVATTGDFVVAEGINYGRKAMTRRDVSGQFDLPWDAARAPIPALRAGSQAEMFLEFPTGVRLHLPKALIERMNITTGGPDEIYRATINYSNQGAFDWVIPVPPP